MAPVEFRDLSKRFGDFAAVEHLSFDIEAGRVTGFLGPNGAGKSTTLRALLGLVRPSSGSATFGGAALRRARAARAPASARCSRTPRSTPGRSARNHLRVLAATGGHPARRVDEVLAAVGLDGRRRPAREGLLDGHAPAPGDRRGAARRPAGADPRRADQRPRPARHQLAARPAARAGRPRPRPCWSPATCWPRSRSRSTTSSSSPTAQLRAQGTLEQVLGGDDGPATEVRAQDPVRLTGALERRGHRVQRDGDVLHVMGATPEQVGEIAGQERVAVLGLAAARALARRGVPRPDWSHGMNALLHAELLKLRTTRTFAVVVGTAALLSLILVALGASLGRRARTRTRCSPTTRSPTSSSCSARSA